MKDKIDTLKYGDLDLPVTDCKVYFTNRFGKKYEVDLNLLIKEFNKNLWKTSKIVK